MRAFTVALHCKCTKINFSESGLSPSKVERPIRSKDADIQHCSFPSPFLVWTFDISFHWKLWRRKLVLCTCWGQYHQISTYTTQDTIGCVKQIKITYWLQRSMKTEQQSTKSFNNNKQLFTFSFLVLVSAWSLIRSELSAWIRAWITVFEWISSLTCFLNASALACRILLKLVIDTI